MAGREVLIASDRNLARTLRHFAVASGGTMVDESGLFLVSLSPTWPGPYHNAVIRLDRALAPAVVLGRAEAFFAERSAGFSVWIADHADSDLEAHAVAAGYAQFEGAGAPRMVLDHPIDPPEPPSEVTLDEVRDEVGVADYLAVTIDAYADSFLPPEAAEALVAGLPSLCAHDARAVVAREDGAPVAAARAVTDGPMASIQLVGTVPAARGRGLGELVTRWAVQAAGRHGASTIVLEASEQGRPIYRHMGFDEMSSYRWVFGPPR